MATPLRDNTLLASPQLAVCKCFVPVASSTCIKLTVAVLPLTAKFAFAVCISVNKNDVSKAFVISLYVFCYPSNISFSKF